MTEDKKIIEEKKYAIVSKESVKTFAEAAGHSGIQDDVAALLAEDVIYRLREATQNGCQFMRHAKRKKLTTEDFNKALKNSDTPPVLGYGASDPMQYRQTREGEVYFVEDHDINLPHVSCNSYVPYKPGQPTLKAQWIAVEGQQKGATLSQSTQGKTNGKVSKGVSEELLAYYDNITKAILGSDEQLMKIALTDIRTNANIAPLLPYLVNFVSNGVKTVSHDINQLTKLLHTVKALVKNPSLYLEPKPFLQMLVQSVTYCLLESLAASINPLNDHWALRDYAARLLALITRNWNSPVNQLRRQNIRALREVLHDHTKPFCCHYGAVIGLLAFGTRVVERVLLPHLPSYWHHLQSVIEEQKDTSYAQVYTDAHKVYGAIMLAAELLIRAKSHQLLHPEEVPSVCDADLDLDLEPPVIDPMAAVETDPLTSTPIKPGFQLAQDLLGPIIQLPDSNSTLQDNLDGAVLQLPDANVAVTPNQLLLNIYTKMYEYFGDSLAMKLPVRYVENFYVHQEKEVFVSLDDEDTQKTGEELLEALLQSSGGLEEDVKSENHSYEPTPEDMEVDYDGDEKSEKSERSERSSRSDRSHSDENLSFLEDTDLTVKAMVSDPSQGIKLTIKKLRIKPPTPIEVKPEPEPEPELEPEPEPLPTPKPRPKIPLADVFELEPMQEPAVKTFVFSFAGWVQRIDYQTPRKTTVFDQYAEVASDLSFLSQSLPPFGHKKCLEHRKQARSHHVSGFCTLGINDLLL